MSLRHSLLLFFKGFLWFLIITATIAIGSLSGILYGLLSNLPQVESLEYYQPGMITTVYSDDDQVLAEFFQEKRYLLPFKKIPTRFIQALLAAEDAQFYQHWGLDFPGIGRALWVDLKARKIVQGGSTITQQLAKILFLTPERTVDRKLKEALLALQIEKRYTKNEILAMYCNQIYFGSGCYGVETAARTYFGKGVDRLHLTQLAMLAGLPKSPESFSPFNNPQKAMARRNYVLKRMREEGVITIKEYENSQRMALGLGRHQKKPQIAQYFAEMTRQYLEDKYGVNMLYRNGLKVYTTLNWNLQQAAESAVLDGINELRERQKISPDAPVQPEAALMAVETGTGNIKAYVGGVSFDRSKFNRVIQAKRQPGSSFKPIFYAKALDGILTPASIMQDTPIVLINPYSGQEWRPQNFDKKYKGAITLRQALQESRNVVSVRLLKRVGVKNAIAFAKKLGITSSLHPYLSLALGSADVTLWEMTGAFSVFANQGMRIEPNYIRHITDSDGKLIEETIPAPQQAISEQTAYLITSLLEGVVQHGTGTKAKVLNRPVAAKTGTTNDFMDAWFIGYVPQLVVGTWVGYDQKKTLGDKETGGQTAAPIWVKFMEKANDKYPVQAFPVPEGIVQINIDAQSGMPATPRCKKIIRESFRRGTEPGYYCTWH
ncbi:MAG: PBP1A family penicillin-binding protein [Candidatus Schekmanbacteria bacterium]|nr:PBP1A family penicillin-binding protein [Candidatus Schekmanbacteria bacterium]